MEQQYVLEGLKSLNEMVEVIEANMDAVMPHPVFGAESPALKAACGLYFNYKDVDTLLDRCTAEGYSTVYCLCEGTLQSGWWLVFDSRESSPVFLVKEVFVNHSMTGQVIEVYDMDNLPEGVAEAIRGIQNEQISNYEADENGYEDDYDEAVWIAGKHKGELVINTL